jgi:hypothetical protein
MISTIILEVDGSDSTTPRTILEAAQAALPDARIHIVRVYTDADHGND